MRLITAATAMDDNGAFLVLELGPYISAALERWRTLVSLGAFGWETRSEIQPEPHRRGRV